MPVPQPATGEAPLLIAMGTRPEFVKLAPLIAELHSRNVPVHVVVTGQHWDDAMCRRFLVGTTPDEQWELSGDGPARLADLTLRAEGCLQRVRPRATVVLGDTHTVPVFALASRRNGVPVIHVEAGLRSLNPQSVEEVNRKVASAVSSLHFAPTELAKRFLLTDGIDADRIHVVGNTAIDALASTGKQIAVRSSRSGVLVTAHRPTNVDGERITDLVASIIAVHRAIGSVTFPVHPRTRTRLHDTGLWSALVEAGVDLLAPVDHDSLLDLLRTSALVVTDSGGLQEEAAYFDVPAVVLRRSTPRWEGIEAGIARLSHLSPVGVVAACTELLRAGAHAPDLYGDGRAAERIVDVVTAPEASALLTLDEPDYASGHLPLPAPTGEREPS